MMASSTCVEKLRASQADLARIIASLQKAPSLDIDDEFEVDYLVESVAKNIKKLQAISAKYGGSASAPGSHSPVGSPPESHRSPVFSSISTPAAPASSVNATTQNSLAKCVGPTTTSICPGTSSLNGTEDEEALYSDDTEDGDYKEPDSRDTSQAAKKNENTSEDGRGDTNQEDDLDDLMTAFVEDEDSMGEEDFNEAALQEIADAEKSWAEETSQADEDTEVESEGDLASQPQEPKYLKVLKQYFGYKKFRPLQWKIISSVLNNKQDQCVIMATGYGKSLCYQYPSVFTGRVTVVISPLISLMQDQVLSLKAVNIEACFLGSAQSETASVKSNMLRGQYRVVYMTPEFIAVAKDVLKSLDEKVGVDLVAIDEAHCVSQWGHDFRTAYRTLGEIRTTLPRVPMMALTATATPQVRRDISKSLQLRNPVFSCTSFNRPNLYLSVFMKTDMMKDLRQELPLQEGELDLDGSVIIYCPTKKATESVYTTVQLLGLRVALYHAGLSQETRKRAHKQFVDDEVQVVVATIAFGMGIDKPDVRKVIHYGAPRDIESYYQEMGRCGRDGQPGECSVYYSAGDINTHKFMLNDIKSASFLEHKKKMLAQMERYLTTTRCRRRSILSHFEDHKSLDDTLRNDCCDNCTRRLTREANGAAGPQDDAEQDFSRPAKDLLEAIIATGNRFGMAVPILFLRGSCSQRLPQAYQKKSEFGMGKYKSEKWWKAFGRLLIAEGYLREVAITNSFGSTVEVSSKGEQWLRQAHQSSSKPLMLLPNQELLQENKENVTVKPTFEQKILPSVQTCRWVSSSEARKQALSAGKVHVDPKEVQIQRELYSKLIGQRNHLSQEKGVPTFVLFNNKSLLDMAKCRPTTMENLLKMEDIAEEKAHKYGEAFLQTIIEFCQAGSVSADRMPDEVTLSKKMDAKQEQALMSLSETVRLSYRLFEVEGVSLEAVGSQRSIQPTTVLNHMADAIRAGLPVDLERLGVTQKYITLITETIRKPPINSDISRMTPIKEQLPDYVSFGHIKVVIAILQRQYGMMDTKLEEPHTSSATPSRPAVPAMVKARSAPAISPASSQKRKLPVWMNKEKSTTSKKLKKNSLFSR